MLLIKDSTRDEVIRSAYAIGRCEYSYALEHLYPLIGRFDEQRKKQSAKFYSRLKADILQGCVMPPVTLAFVSEQGAKLTTNASIQAFVHENIKDGYILDGMQRLNTLKSASDDLTFPAERHIHVNIIITERYDLLLYRMITLNNGQKPMTPRHQIEILTENLLDFMDLKNIVVQTEKETEDSLVHGSFKLFDLSAAYTSFLTNNVNNSNNKIIDEKMNEILVGRVMESDLSHAKVEFSKIIELVDLFSENKDARTWLKIQNNLVGFTVGSKAAFDQIQQLSPDEFAAQVEKFDSAFTSVNPSKVNVGRYRRELSSLFFKEFADYSKLSADEVSESFFEETMSD
ncbi:hypothetical protein [Qipengyuania flava]|uniref:hypothetical protein n=1 Tax=Qipengyuania flava TaxID=192812 RepID=UPI00321998A3